MGAAVSVVPLAVIGIAALIRGASGSGRVRENPVMAELQQRIQKQEQSLRTAKADQAKAEEARRNAEKAARQAEEQKVRLQESAKRQKEERRRAEEARKKAEQQSKIADENRRKAEDQKRQAENGAKKADEERAKATAEAQRAQQEQKKADQARREAEKVAADARAARDEAEKNLREGIRPIIIPTQAQFNEAKLRLQYKQGLFHFAIAGIAGSGKSSLINAFRGLRNNDSGAAPTGIIETTSVIARYPDPNSANPFVWYDVPGAGTLSIPDWQYFTDQGLYIFDCIVVLFDNRFTATDIAILRNCARFQIPTYIVRSKSKQHIQNILEDMLGEDDADAAAKGTARAKYIRETRASVERNLKAAGLTEQQVYMIDKETLVQVVKGRQPREYIDEWVLLRDVLGEGRRRRVVEN